MLESKSVYFTGVCEILRLDFMWFVKCFLLLNMGFLVEFDKMLYFQWFEGILEGDFDDF